MRSVLENAKCVELKESVYEWRDSGTRRENNQTGQQNEAKNNGQKPEFLSLL
jgi:hypothetical protein